MDNEELKKFIESFRGDLPPEYANRLGASGAIDAGEPKLEIEALISNLHDCQVKVDDDRLAKLKELVKVYAVSDSYASLLEQL